MGYVVPLHVLLEPQGGTDLERTTQGGHNGREEYTRGQ